MIKKPKILTTMDEVHKWNKRVPAIDLGFYIEGKYTLPLVIYTDSGNYSKKENYLHSPLELLSHNRLVEIILALRNTK